MKNVEWKKMLFSPDFLCLVRWGKSCQNTTSIFMIIRKAELFADTENQHNAQFSG